MEGEKGEMRQGSSALVKILLFILLLNIAAFTVLAVYVAKGTDQNIVCKTEPVSGSNLHEVTSAPTSAPSGQATEREVCVTPECVNAASYLIKSIDASVSPCDDFYQFSCGNWEARHQIPEGDSRFSTFGMIGDEIDITLQDLLEAPATQNDQPYVTKVKDFFSACMNFSHINSLGSQPVKDLIAELGGWPLVTSGWSGQTFSLTELLLKVNKYNLAPLVIPYVTTDILEPAKQNIHIDQTDFGLPGNKYYNINDTSNQKFLEAYKEYIYGVAQLIGFANSSTANADVDDVINFEVQLAAISDSDEKRRDPYAMNNPMTLQEFSANYSVPGILDMANFTKRLMSLPGVDATITDQEVVVIEAPDYLIKLKDLLAKTPAKTVANYVVWRSVKDNIGMLTLDFRNLYSNFRKVVYGITSDSPRQKTCLGYVSREMGFAAGRMYLDAEFPAQARTKADDMIDHLQSAFTAHLQELSWMDDQTKVLAKEKCQAITGRIGYPDSTMNDTYLIGRYKDVTIGRDSFYQNVLQTKHRSFVDDARRYGKPTDLKRWSDPPQTVNAYYSPDKNQITFPAGILHAPFFQHNYPNYLNYGGMGMVIGHEMTHGFDDQGRQFDLRGKLKNWWTNETSRRYDDRAQCIIDQYGGMTTTIDGKVYNLNGITTQGENIADNGGIKISYKAYKAWEASQDKPEPGLPGLKYTNDQLFFINFGQSFCGLAKDEHIIELIKTDPHPPGFFRIRGVAMNMPNFGQVFNCPAGSKMNPEKKCSVW